MTYSPFDAWFYSEPDNGSGVEPAQPSNKSATITEPGERPQAKLMSGLRKAAGVSGSTPEFPLVDFSLNQNPNLNPLERAKNVEMPTVRPSAVVHAEQMRGDESPYDMICRLRSDVNSTPYQHLARYYPQALAAFQSGDCVQMMQWRDDSVRYVLRTHNGNGFGWTVICPRTGEAPYQRITAPDGQVLMTVSSSGKITSETRKPEIA